MVLGLGKRSPGSGEYSRSDIYPNISDEIFAQKYPKSESNCSRRSNFDFREVVPGGSLPGGHGHADGDGEARLLNGGTIQTFEQPKMEPAS